MSFAAERRPQASPSRKRNSARPHPMTPAQFQDSLVEQGIPTQSSPVKAVLFRGVAGGAGGGIASAGVEAYRIAVLEDRPHSARETTLRLGREGAIGATSGVLGTIAGTALTGALAGSVAPGVGTAAGFVVGFIVGVGSALVLNSVVPTVEQD